MRPVWRAWLAAAQTETSGEAPPRQTEQDHGCRDGASLDPLSQQRSVDDYVRYGAKGQVPVANSSEAVVVVVQAVQAPWAMKPMPSSSRESS